MRTAFSEVPWKWPIFRVCFTHRKNNSMAHRRLYKSAISWALAVRSLVKIRNSFPVSITTRTSRTNFDIGFRREAARRFGRYPVRSIRIVDDVRFGATNSRRKRRPIAAQVAQLHAGRIDQTDAIADFAPIAGLQLSHQNRKQAREHLSRTLGIRRRQCRLRQRAATEVIELARMAFQACFDLAQSTCACKLPVQHRDQMTFAGHDATIPVTIVLSHKAIEHGPRNVLQKSMKNDILMLHGFDPFVSR